MNEQKFNPGIGNIIDRLIEVGKPALEDERFTIFKNKLLEQAKTEPEVALERMFRAGIHFAVRAMEVEALNTLAELMLEKKAEAEASQKGMVN